MNIIQRVKHWGDTHHPKWIDIIRMCLGIFFLLKAVQFINNMNQLSSVLGKYQSHFLIDFSLGAMRYYTIMIHIIGGFMVLFGCLTRLACIIQIPILLWALLFFNSPTGVMAPDSSWWLSLLVLLLLFFFTLEGGGPWSADRLLDSHPEKGH
jgi:putative oxidoreductase